MDETTRGAVDREDHDPLGDPELWLGDESGLGPGSEQPAGGVAGLARGGDATSGADPAVVDDRDEGSLVHSEDGAATGGGRED